MSEDQLPFISSFIIKMLFSDLQTKVLKSENKRFYLDVKENNRGRFLKITEVCNLSGPSKFHKAPFLFDFIRCPVYSFIFGQCYLILNFCVYCYICSIFCV